MFTYIEERPIHADAAPKGLYLFEAEFFYFVMLALNECILIFPSLDIPIFLLLSVNTLFNSRRVLVDATQIGSFLRNTLLFNSSG